MRGSKAPSWAWHGEASCLSEQPVLRALIPLIQGMQVDAGNFDAHTHPAEVPGNFPHFDNP
jgi:hypothetical protein